MTPATLRKLVAEASASPSVHNVQPARWRIEGETLVLLEDLQRRLAVGDPTGNDASLSLGAAAEGLVLAASRIGLAARLEPLSGSHGDLRQVARFHFDDGAAEDPLAPQLLRRASWRGPFLPAPGAVKTAAQSLAGPDCTIVTDPAAIGQIAALYDRASFGFMRKDGFRAELLGWMRLKKSHPDWARDGLNAEAMKLSAIEAFGAGLVLGPLFRLLSAVGLARPLLAEASAFRDAAGIALFHRPAQEDPFESGRHFHRCWLAIEKAGFGANVLAALADDEAAATRLCSEHGIPSGNRLVSAFRFGLRKGDGFAPARLPLDTLLLD